MPSDQVAYEPSLSTLLASWILISLCVCAGHDVEPFWHVRQHDVQHEKQDAGDASKLCEFTLVMISFSISFVLLLSQTVVAPKPCVFVCVSGEHVHRFKHPLIQLLINHDIFKGWK